MACWRHWMRSLQPPIHYGRLWILKKMSISKSINATSLITNSRASTIPPDQSRSSLTNKSKSISSRSKFLTRWLAVARSLQSLYWPHLFLVQYVQRDCGWSQVRFLRTQCSYIISLIDLCLRLTKFIPSKIRSISQSGSMNASKMAQNLT